MSSLLSIARRRAKAASLPAVALTAGALLASVLAGAQAVRAEDVAICIGVNKYPGLHDGANLDGCVNDARLFAQKLQLYGFRRIIVLADQEATKGGILSAISGVNASLGSGDRVVVFFAGHGTFSSDGKAVILPGDAQENTEANDLGVDDLYSAVKSLHSGAKTIVLDSCHSGAMARAFQRGFKGFRSRAYHRHASRGLKAWTEDTVNGSDDLHNVVPDGGNGNGGNGGNAGDGTICYFTAAQKNEVAAEMEMNGEPHGVFTYCLANAMKGQGDLWRDLSAAVADQVGSNTDHEQTPLLYPTTFLSDVVFGGSAAPKPRPFSLQNVWNLNRPDPDKVMLRRFPNMTPVPVGTHTYFTVDAGADGYLVVLNRDPKGDFYLLYPKGTPTAMPVRAGQSVRIPTADGRTVSPDTPGVDNVRAILFSSQEAAAAMLKPFAGAAADRGGPRRLSSREATRAWKEDQVSADDPFYTSTMTTLIVPAAGSSAGMSH